MQISKKWKDRITLVASTLVLSAAALFVEEPVVALLGLQEHGSIAFVLGSISVTLVALTVRYLPNTHADELCDERVHAVALQVHQHVVSAHLQPVRDLLVKLHHLHLDVVTDREKEELIHNIKRAIKEVETKLAALEEIQEPEVIDSYNQIKL